MSRALYNKMLLPRRIGIKHRRYKRGLVYGSRAVAAAEDEIVGAEEDVDGAGEGGGGGDDEADCEELAKGLGLFCGY